MNTRCVRTAADDAAKARVLKGLAAMHRSLCACRCMVAAHQRSKVTTDNVHLGFELRWTFIISHQTCHRPLQVFQGLLSAKASDKA